MEGYVTLKNGFKRLEDNFRMSNDDFLQVFSLIRPYPKERSFHSFQECYIFEKQSSHYLVIT